MTCPFCGREMAKGILSGDGRCPVTWKQGNRKAGFIDQVVGSGVVTAAKKSLTTFTIESWFCRDCLKMVFDTDVTR